MLNILLLSPLELYELECMLAFLEDSPVLGTPARGFCCCNAFQSVCIPEAVVCWLACVLFTWWVPPACIHCLLQHLERPNPCLFTNRCMAGLSTCQVRQETAFVVEQQHSFIVICDSWSWLRYKCCTFPFNKTGALGDFSQGGDSQNVSQRIAIYVWNSIFQPYSLCGPWAESCCCCINLWDLLGLVLVAEKSWGRKSFASCWFMALVNSPEKHSENFLDLMWFQLTGSSRLLFDHVE